MIHTNIHIQEIEAESECQSIASVPVKTVSNIHGVIIWPVVSSHYSNRKKCRQLTAVEMMEILIQKECQIICHLSSLSR